MCLIVDRPPETQVPEEILATAIADNPDGWGILWSDGDRLHIQRGLLARAFWDAWGDIAPEVHATLHFRWATHGSVSLANVHPFQFGAAGQTYGLVHNGVVKVAMSRPDRSDTWHFAHAVVKPTLAKYPDRFGHGGGLVGPLENRAGYHNKLVVVRQDGARMFLNRDAGFEEDGVWYSNLNSHPGYGFGYSTRGWRKEGQAWVYERQPERRSTVLTPDDPTYDDPTEDTDGWDGSVNARRLAEERAREDMDWQEYWAAREESDAYRRSRPVLATMPTITRDGRLDMAEGTDREREATSRVLARYRL